jgi:nicotinamidase-related amidase
MKALQSIRIDPDNAILVIVDVENEFCKPDGKLYSEVSTRVAPRVISAIQELSERARNAGIHIIYIQSVRTLQETEFAVFGQEPILQIGTWASKIVDELEPQKGDIVVQKFCHDPFFNTDLEQVLRRLVPDPTNYYAVVTGGDVGVCLYHTVMGFHLRDYWTIVPVDCVYYSSEARNQRALEQFSDPPYPNVFLSRSDLIEVSKSAELPRSWPKPGT